MTEDRVREKKGRRAKPRRRAWSHLLESILFMGVALVVSLEAVAVTGAPLLSGTVVDSDGRAVPGAMVILAAEAMEPTTLTVFTDREGKYAMPAPERPAPARDTSLTCRKLGYTPVRQSLTAGQEGVDCMLSPADDVAGQVPPSLWWRDAPDTLSHHRTMATCSDCHQFPAAAVRRGVPPLDSFGPEDRVRFWNDTIERMRLRYFAGFPAGGNFNRDDVIEQLKYEFLSRHEQEVIAPYLAEHYPLEMSRFPASELPPAAPFGPDRATVLKEYRMPKDAFLREVTFARGCRYMWGADQARDRVLRMDLTDGTRQWLEFPAQESVGPHTIDHDAEGNIWLATLDNDFVAKLDPEEIRWTRIYRLRPGSMVHDFALNSRSEVAFDLSGHLWVSLITRSQLARLDPETGEAAYFDLPVVEGETPMHSVTYGAVMTSDRRTVWFTQLNGHLGAFDTETLEVVTAIPYPNGSMPRRMAIDDDDVLWIPLTGASRLVAYDTRSKREIARYELPDLSASPYVAYWDRIRRVIWVGTQNSNSLYQFDPETRQFKEFPFPSHGAVVRKMAVCNDNGALWTSYAAHPASTDRSSMAVVLQLDQDDDSARNPLSEFFSRLFN